MATPVKIDVSIANGASLSSAASLDMLSAERRLVGLVLPATWTAAGIGFLVSYDGGTTYVQLSRPRVTSAPPFNLDELEILAADVPTSESVLIALDPAWFAGATHVKVKSQTAGSAVNQGGARTIGLMVRDV